MLLVTYRTFVFGGLLTPQGTFFWEKVVPLIGLQVSCPYFLLISFSLYLESDEIIDFMDRLSDSLCTLKVIHCKKSEY